MRRTAPISLLLLAVAGVGIFVYWYTQIRPDAVDPDSQAMFKRVPVPTNAGTDVLPGFRGDVHPLRHRQTAMEVTARWTLADVGVLFPDMPADLDEVRRLYTGVGVIEPSKSYSARDLSIFLPPANAKSAGQTWFLDPERVVEFLKQFNPSISAHSASVGRRPGPDGAFALLRGASANRLDIVFRVHAEFDLAPKSKRFRARNAWYTPSCFLGRIVVNRAAGTVEYFQMGVPTDLTRNIHATVRTAPDNEHPKGYRIYQFLRADRMELTGGSLQGIDGVPWTEQIDMARAHEKLAKLFYKFLEIDFVPFTQALAIARERKKPIFAVIPVGALDDQSC